MSFYTALGFEEMYCTSDDVIAAQMHCYAEEHPQTITIWTPASATDEDVARLVEDARKGYPQQPVVAKRYSLQKKTASGESSGQV